MSVPKGDGVDGGISRGCWRIAFLGFNSGAPLVVIRKADAAHPEERPSAPNCKGLFSEERKYTIVDLWLCTG